MLCIAIVFVGLQLSIVCAACCGVFAVACLAALLFVLGASGCAILASSTKKVVETVVTLTEKCAMVKAAMGGVLVQRKLRISNLRWAISGESLGGAMRPPKLSAFTPFPAAHVIDVSLCDISNITKFLLLPLRYCNKQLTLVSPPSNLLLKPVYINKALYAN